MSGVIGPITGRITMSPLAVSVVIGPDPGGNGLDGVASNAPRAVIPLDGGFAMIVTSLGLTPEAMANLDKWDAGAAAAGLPPADRAEVERHALRRLGPG